MWGPMGCRDRWTAAEHVPGTARPQCFSGKEEAGRYQVEVSGLTSAARAVVQSWRCWQGRAGEVAPVGCWSLSNQQRWSFLGTSRCTAACLLQHCPHPPQAAQWEVLPPCWLHHTVLGQNGTPECLWALLNPDLGFFCQRLPTPSPWGRKVS